MKAHAIEAKLTLWDNSAGTVWEFTVNDPVGMNRAKAMASGLRRIAKAALEQANVTQRAFTEALLKATVAAIFESGGNPDTIMLEAQLAISRMQAEFQLEREQMAMQAEMDRQRMAVGAVTALDKNRQMSSVRMGGRVG